MVRKLRLIEVNAKKVAIHMQLAQIATEMWAVFNHTTFLTAANMFQPQFDPI